MKKIVYLFLLLAIISCSNDDDSSNGDSNGNVNEDYFPLTENNSWEYNVTTTNDQGNPPTTSTDIITVAGTSTINNNLYYDLDANAGATGTMTTLLTENFVRTADGKYHMEGEVSLELSAIGGEDILIELNDIVILDQGATVGSVLGTVTGTSTQVIQNFDVTIDYTLRTVQQGTFSSHSVNNGAIVYNDVIASQIIIEVSASTVYNNIPISILSNQDILTIDNFYAQNIGLIDSDAVFSYTLNQLPIDLGVPTTATSTTTQELNTYTIYE